MVVVVYYGHLSGNCHLKNMATKNYNFMKKNSEYDLIKKEIDERGTYGTWSSTSNILFRKPFDRFIL